MCELTEVKRQRMHQLFIEIVNNIRTGRAIDFDLDLLAKRKTNIEKVKTDTTFLYVENAVKDTCKSTNLAKIPFPLFEIMAIDKFPAHIPPHIIKSFQACTQSKKGGLALNLIIKKDARIMLTSNIDIADRLGNVQLGTVIDFQCPEGTFTKICVKFDDFNAGMIKRD